MALMSKATKRVELTHEPGQWIDVRLPSFYMVQHTADLTYDWPKLFESCIKAWSYEEPVTPENILELDVSTVSLLIEELFPSIQTEEDIKKNSRPSRKR